MIVKAASLYKQSFTGLSAQSWLLSLIMLINRSGTMVLPFMTLYLTGPEMHRSLTEAGFVMALFGLGSIVGAYFGGKLTDNGGFFKVQLCTLFCGGILFIVLGQIRSYPLICVFTFLLSLVNEAFRPANSSAIAFYSTVSNRTRSYSLNRLAINLGWAIGASAGGIIATINYELLFWVDGITNIFAAVLLYVFLHPGKIPKHHLEQHTQAEGPADSAYKDKGYLWFILFSTIFSVCFFQLFTTIPKYFRDGLGLSEDFIGFTMAVNGLIIVCFEMVLVFVLEKRNKIARYIALGTAICGIGFFSLLLPGPAPIITMIMILFMTFGEIMAMPFMNTFWTQRSSSSNRGQYAALYTIAWGAGQTLGPLICSVIADNYGFPVTFILLGILLSATAYGFSTLKAKAITL